MKSIPFSRAMIGVMLTYLVLLVNSTNALASYDYQVLQSLGKPEGTPRGKLVQGSDGNFYGTTYYGGSNAAGTVFKISSTGNFTTLHEFDGAEGGANPQAGLIQASDGTFYGTTVNGGGSDAGIVFKIDSSGNFSILHELDGANDGAHPNASLIQANDGNFYGTTESGAVFKMSPSGSFNILYQYSSGLNGVIQGSDGNLYGTSNRGGSYDSGTAFKLDLSGNLTILHEFGSDSYGYYPVGSLIQATDGSFYGVTWTYAYVYPISTFFKIDSSGNYTHLTTISGQSQGGLIQASDGNFYITSGVFFERTAGNFGWVTKIDASGTATILYSFTGGSGGANPYAALVQGRDGRLYGTTEEGGNGSGAVFQLDLAGNFQVLHDFEGLALSSPTSLVQASDGSFYGTASGGSYSSYGYGAVFKMDTSGNLSVLHSFNGSSDGAFPVGLLVDDDGSLYGATSGGMLDFIGGYAPSTIYKIDPDGNFSVLYTYDTSGGQYGIYSDIIEATDGFFYGTFAGGGSNGDGSVFKLDPASGSLSVLHDFDGTGGAGPWGGVSQGVDGSFYGTTGSGGSYGVGVVYRLDQSGNFSVLHEFDGIGGGAVPEHGVLQGSDGNFYGSVYSDNNRDAGIIYKLDSLGNFSILQEFENDVGYLQFQDADGSFWGTSGSAVFKLDPAGTLTNIHSFDGTDGSNPVKLIKAKDGSLYGITSWISRNLDSKLRLVLYLSVDHGQTWSKIASPKNSGSKDWRVPKNRYGSKQALFKLCVKQDESLCDVSDAVFTINKVPKAEAGKRQKVTVGTEVHLDGSASVDADNGPSPLTYQWTQKSGPAITLNGADTANPSFVPTVKGVYKFSLVVNDGAAESKADKVTVRVLNAP